MSQPDYRYFLGFRPDFELRCWLDQLADEAGQRHRRIKKEHFHLTLCVISELNHRDRFIASRTASALAGHPLVSCPFWLSRLRGGPGGAAVCTRGRQRELQDFYTMLVGCLAERDILPLHRKRGLQPHATLGYDPCAIEMLLPAREWIPNELLLIESEVGRGIHNVLTRWPLLPPRQGSFVFGGPPDLNPLRLVEGGATGG